MRQLWLLAPLAATLLGSATLPPSLPLDLAALDYGYARCLPEERACAPLVTGGTSPAAAPILPTEPVVIADESQSPLGPPAGAVAPLAPAPRWHRRSAQSAWAPPGLRVVISIPQQRAYVFQDGALLATSRVSTGKPGHETPAGTFHILQKAVTHHSNKYSNAPMPYMQRLTSSGIALHAGHLPGYPASHGCIRLPWSFARKLYGLTGYGTSVTITRMRPKSSAAALDLT
jgi:hypothetical protein